MKSDITFEVIENSGPDNLRDTLKAKFTQASEVFIAVAFLTQAGLDEIIQPLRQVAERGKVNLITGLYQHVTEPKALKTLLDIQRETRGRFSVCLSTEPQFHRKIYLLESRIQATAIIGSSNLTKEGLQSGGELNAMMSLPKTSPSIQKLRSVLEQEWEHRTVSLTADKIERYERARIESDKSRNFTQSGIEKILKVKPTHTKATPAPLESINFWRDCVTGYADERTRQVIKETTNWDNKYFWYSTGGKHSYCLKDRILLFDKTDNYLRLVEVKGIAQTKISTPDGKNFVAYKEIRGYKRKLTETLWKLLKVEGIKKKNFLARKRLSVKKAEQLASLVK